MITDKQLKELKMIIPNRWCLRYKDKARHKHLLCFKDTVKGIEYSCDECLRRTLEKILKKERTK